MYIDLNDRYTDISTRNRFFVNVGKITIFIKVRFVKYENKKVNKNGDN